VAIDVGAVEQSGRTQRFEALVEQLSCVAEEFVRAFSKRFAALWGREILPVRASGWVVGFGCAAVEAE
jgi:hypothetical protein